MPPAGPPNELTGANHHGAAPPIGHLRLGGSAGGRHTSDGGPAFVGAPRSPPWEVLHLHLHPAPEVPGVQQRIPPPLGHSTPPAAVKPV